MIGGPLDWLALAPRSLRRVIAFAFLLGLWVLPGSTQTVFWSEVHSEAQKLKPLLNEALIGTLYRDRHTDLCSGGTKQCREKSRRPVRGSALRSAKR